LGIWPMVAIMLLLSWLVSRYPERAIRHRLQALRRRVRLRTTFRNV
jgi:hypothetical protein